MAQQRDDRDEEESTAMASESEESMLEAHKSSYQVFMRLLGYATAGIAVVLILLAIFLL